MKKRDEYFEAFVKTKRELEKKYQERLEIFRELQSLARKKKDVEDRLAEIYDRLKIEK